MIIFLKLYFVNFYSLYVRFSDTFLTFAMIYARLFETFFTVTRNITATTTRRT